MDQINNTKPIQQESIMIAIRAIQAERNELRRLYLKKRREAYRAFRNK